jgi:UDP-N-acetylmuramoyl-L-alanyl-D-glutamate--2,6-diaminopimelate ligase
MQWVDALSEVRLVECASAAADVLRVEYDSRRVGPGAAFVAMRGGSTDGNRYIDNAIEQGAVAVVTDSREAYKRLRQDHPQIGAALVEHGRRALAELAAAVLGHPERKLAISAVTGTNGKTTTAFLLEQILRAAGRKTVLMGTVETRVVGEVRDSSHTTPESRDIFEIFADGVRAGATEAVMEMSSHALVQERVWGIPVDVAIFTNLTQDHLDYHGTMERYAAAKARLFEGVGTPAPRFAVINANDPYSATMIGTARRYSEVLTYRASASGAAATPASFEAYDVSLGPSATSFKLQTDSGTFDVKSKLVGRVNVENLLAAIAAATARGVALREAVQIAASLNPVPGRFETVENELGITVVVDYAHTDDALRNLIAVARGVSTGRVITLFGCGGDRDRTKRSKMGRAAGEGSDLVVLTSDNPRSEEPIAIIEEALAGVRTTSTDCVVEPDRSAAIATAIRSARCGDIVLIAGKGHEKLQVLRDRTVPFDDVAVASGVLWELEK